MSIRAFCTALDVMILDRSLTSSVRPIGELDTAILQSTGVVKAFLYPVYGTSDATYQTTPYGTTGIPRFVTNVDDLTTANSGTSALGAVTVNSTAETEYWTILFTSSTAYTCTGSISGAQGNSTVSTNFTTTNGDITISATSWSGTASTGDSFNFASYSTLDSLIFPTSFLSIATILESVKAGELGGGDTARVYYNRAMDFLDRLSRPLDKGGMQLSSFSSQDTSALDYSLYGLDIDDYGLSTATYKTDELVTSSFGQYPSATQIYWWLS